MARTTEPSPSHRIKKSRTDQSSSRSTRQRTRMMVASAFDRNLWQDMAGGAQEVVEGASSVSGGTAKAKGKARAVGGPEAFMNTKELNGTERFACVPDEEVMCPITDKDAKPFRIMELPTEIRLEIYRACLTRPYNILLSKREQPPDAEPEDEEQSNVMDDSHSDADDTDDDTQRRGQLAHEQPILGPVPTIARPSLATGRRSLSSRGSRPVRLLTSRSAPGHAGSVSTGMNSNRSQHNQSLPTLGMLSSLTGAPGLPATSQSARRNGNGRSTVLTVSEPPRNQSADPLLVNILRASKEIYKEARSVLYSENFFTLDLNTAQSTLPCLHQRSRRQIKHIELEIPTYNEILERFQETVRLSLRYCSGLKKFVIHMPFTLPGADGSGTTGNTTVYANGFDILRWLPQQCDVVLEGNICVEIETVVNKHLRLAKTLDKVSHPSHQFQTMSASEIEQWRGMFAARNLHLSSPPSTCDSSQQTLAGKLAYARRQLISNDTPLATAATT